MPAQYDRPVTADEVAPPVLDIDLFSDESLQSPYENFRRIRQGGGLALLPVHRCYAAGSYEAIRTALTDWETFSSAQGVSLNDHMNEFQMGTTLLGTDPPAHQRLQQVVARHLGPKRLSDLDERMCAEADRLVASLVGRASFDAVADLAQILPVSTISTFLGLPDYPPARILDFADRHFDAFGPLGLHAGGDPSERVAAGWAKMYTGEALIRFLYKRLEPGGMGDHLKDAVDAGTISELEALRLLSTLLVAGLDTTVLSISAIVHALATHPREWDHLRRNPGDAAAAFAEILRWDSPSQMLARTTTRPCRLAGFDLPAHSRILLIYAAGNRDPDAFEDADRFWIGRPVRQNLSFSGGVHACLGQALARMQGLAVLRALLRHVGAIEMAGTPRRNLNSVLRGWGSMPVRFRAPNRSRDTSRPRPSDAGTQAAGEPTALARQLRNWRRIVRTKRPEEETRFWNGLPSHPLAETAVPLDVRSFGEGPNVLWVPGVGGRGSQFGPMAEDLAARGFRSVMLEFGSDTDRRVHYGGIDVIGRQILAVARREGAVHGVVTHSMGNPWTWYAMAAGLRTEMFVSLSGIFEAAFVYDRFQRSQAMTGDAMAAFEQRLVAEEGDRPRWWQDPSKVLHEIERPRRALLVQGVDDEIVPRGQGRAFAAAWPDALYEEVKDTTHQAIVGARPTIAMVGAFFSAGPNPPPVKEQTP